MIAAYIAWRSDQVLYGSYLLIFAATMMVCVYLHKFVLLEEKHEQRNTVGLFEH